MDYIAVRTILPIFILIGTGLFSRKTGVLQSGDERVLSSYVYYFALPALLFINLAETTFTRETLQFMLAGVIPVLIVIPFYWIIRVIWRFSKNTLYLLILSTVFGSTAFFGIPFIMFAFPTDQGEHLAILSVVSISPVSITIAITTLELYKLGKTTIWKGLNQVLKKLSTNPLILSILSGIVITFTGIEIPTPLSKSLHMLGSTTTIIAIFMLGVFLYGRRYTNITKALTLSLLRIIILPVVALLITKMFNLPNIERAILVLMHSVPVAISMIILSERYGFFKDIIASLILISSIGAAVYLNVWLWVLGYGL
ncbi:MAG TPA: AEC family transporter [Desulfatiglandales bacterium]|nr:AEC family transporter [Desulfatiglandales bacterium]